MMNTLPNLSTTAQPSQRVIANLKQLARAVKPCALYVMVGDDKGGRNMTCEYRMPFDKN